MNGKSGALMASVANLALLKVVGYFSSFVFGSRDVVKKRSTAAIATEAKPLRYSVRRCTAYSMPFALFQAISNN